MNTTLPVDVNDLALALVVAAKSVVEADRVVMDLYSSNPKPHPLRKKLALQARCERLQELRVVIQRLEHKVGSGSRGIFGPSFVGV